MRHIATRIPRGVVVLSVCALTFSALAAVASRQESPVPSAGLGITEGASQGAGQVGIIDSQDTPTHLTIGGYVFTVPAGATAIEYIAGPPAINSLTDEPVSQPNHVVYWLISRNHSTAKIDSRTGDIFDWFVDGEDSIDFEALLTPVPVTESASND